MLRKSLMSLALSGGITTGLIGVGVYSGLAVHPQPAVAADNDNDKGDVNQKENAQLREALTHLQAAHRILDERVGGDDTKGHRAAAKVALKKAIDELNAALGNESYEAGHDKDNK